MFERFTEPAREVVVLAQDEARALKHNYIGTEHILLALLRDQGDVPARVLDSFDVTLEEVRAQVARIIGQGDEVSTGQIPITPRAKKVLELALREALALKHGHIGPEHILLGLMREGEGVAVRILLDFDATPSAVAARVVETLKVEAPPRYSASFREAPRPAFARKSAPVSSTRAVESAGPIVVGWLLFAVALGIGILIGWAIWG